MEAIQEARSRCSSEHCRMVLWAYVRNRCVAEVTQRGLEWRCPDFIETHRLMTCTNPEWPRMWDCLFALTKSYTDLNPEAHEAWQYTGSYWKDYGPPEDGMPRRVLIHEFRHRNRPATAKPIPGVPRSSGRLVLHLAASIECSGGWNRDVKEGSLIV